METSEILRVSFYGSLADAIGRSVDVPFAPGGTVAELRRRLAELHPEAASILERPAVRACVDDVMVGEEHMLSAAADVAFLPPLSGG